MADNPKQTAWASAAVGVLLLETTPSALPSALSIRFHPCGMPLVHLFQNMKSG